LFEKLIHRIGNNQLNDPDLEKERKGEQPRKKRNRRNILTKSTTRKNRPSAKKKKTHLGLNIHTLPLEAFQPENITDHPQFHFEENQPTNQPTNQPFIYRSKII